MKNKNLFCKVCGFSPGFFPWGENGLVPSFEICDCCGTEFGYEDSNEVSISKKRSAFLLSGCEWFNKKAKPNNWLFEEQMKNIL